MNAVVERMPPLSPALRRARRRTARRSRRLRLAARSRRETRGECTPEMESRGMEELLRRLLRRSRRSAPSPGARRRAMSRSGLKPASPPAAVASSASMAAINRGQSGPEPVRIAEQHTAAIQDLGGQDRVAELRGEAFGFVEDVDAAGRVGEAMKASEAVEEPAARPFLPVDARRGGRRRLAAARPRSARRRPAAPGRPPAPATPRRGDRRPAASGRRPRRDRGWHPPSAPRRPAGARGGGAVAERPRRAPRG